MNKLIQVIFLFIVILNFISACVSMSSLQSARTLKKGEWSFATGFGQESLKFIQKTNDVNSQTKEDLEEIKVPILEFYTKYGLFDKLDLGLKFTSPASISFDTKYMLLGKGRPLSFSLGIGYISTSYETHIIYEGFYKTRAEDKLFLGKGPC